MKNAKHMKTRMPKPKLTMLRGLPGSGKTTLARRMAGPKSAARVNRDDLRAMIFDSEWSAKREGIIVECEKALARILLSNGLSVVVDDTNLGAKAGQIWAELAAEGGAKFHIKDLTRLSIETCISRDAGREKSVGEDVIRRMASQAGIGS